MNDVCQRCGRSIEPTTAKWAMCFYCENNVDEDDRKGGPSLWASRCQDIKPGDKGDGRIVRKAIT